MEKRLSKFYESLGRRVKKLREKQKLNQYQLSEKAEISEKYLSRIECGTVKCSTDIISRIAKALGISVDFLVNGGTKEDGNIQMAAAMLKKLSPQQQDVIIDIAQRLEDYMIKGK